MFGTYELVEAILSGLFTFELGAAVNACVTWRKIVEKRIPTHSSMPFMKISLHPALPPPQIHPIFRSLSGWQEHEAGQMFDRLALHDYLTEPLVTYVRLWYGTPAMDVTWSMELNTQNGLRLGHVQYSLRMAQKLNPDISSKDGVWWYLRDTHGELVKVRSTMTIVATSNA